MFRILAPTLVVLALSVPACGGTGSLYPTAIVSPADAPDDSPNAMTEGTIPANISPVCAGSIGGRLVLGYGDRSPATG